MRVKRQNQTKYVAFNVFTNGSVDEMTKMIQEYNSGSKHYKKLFENQDDTRVKVRESWMQ